MKRRRKEGSNQASKEGRKERRKEGRKERRREYRLKVEILRVMKRYYKKIKKLKWR